MDYRPNIDAVLWFAREVMPGCAGAMPAARFWIVGAARPGGERARDAAGCQVTGRVPDTRPYSRRRGRGAAADRPRHPEQGAGGDGDGETRGRHAGGVRRHRANPGRDILLASGVDERCRDRRGA